MSPKTLLLISGAAVIAACSNANTPLAEAQDSTQTDVVKKDIFSKKLADGLYLLTGPGGNIGVSIGEDGVFVIDDKFDRFGQQIIDEIAALTDQPIRYVINTHYHGDHTGANAKMKTVGATIVAHDNVRARMGMQIENLTFGRTVEPTDPDQWPTLTFSENMTFHFNGHTVEAIHAPTAHTDGDSIIHFKEANMVHMGDNFFLGMFPYVDVDGGGSLQGMIDAHDRVLAMIDDETQIIPGHGPMAGKADLQKTRDSLADIQARVKAEMDAGADLNTILNKKVLADYKDLAGFIDEDNMVRIAFRSLGGKLPSK